VPYLKAKVNKKIFAFNNERNLMLKSKNAQVLFGLNNNILLVLFVV
jgi:hypothetical protein